MKPSSITYSFPLISSDHKVYGVAGVEISLDFLKKYLPYEELNDDSSNAYLLACKIRIPTPMK